MSESRRITRSKSLAIDSKSGKKLEHLHTIDMSKEETVEVFEKMLQPIKEALSKLMTEEVMLIHLEGLKSTFVQQLEEQKHCHKQSQGRQSPTGKQGGHIGKFIENSGEKVR